MEAWSTACPDWRERLIARRSLIPDLPLFEDEAERAVRIFKRLKLPDVIGTPTMAEAFDERIFELVATVFGSYDAAINRRMIQEFFLLIPKKNAKSTIAAAIMVVAAIMNRRPSAEFLLIAPTKEIADIAFRQAEGIIRLDAELSKLFHTARHVRTIEHRLSRATIQIKAADTDVITGSKSTGILIDETHEFARKASAQKIFIEVRGALAARPDGFMIQITTQSKDAPAGVFKSELNIARGIRDGRVRLPRLPILYELPHELAKDGGWKDEATWSLVNPNLGRSVDREFLRNALIAAEQDSDPASAMALLASQHFNVEIGLSLLADRWPGADFWPAAADEGLTLEALLARSEVVVAGIDGGGLDDLLGLGVIGRERETRRWLHWGRAWAHPSVLDRRKELAPLLRDLAAAGDLSLVDQLGQDIDELVEIVATLDESGLLAQVGLDPQSVGAIVDALAERDITAPERVVGVSQGWKLTGAIKTTERKLADGTFRHGGQALMAWCVGNAKVEPRGNAIMITKQAAGSAKIDPLMALFDAVALMSMNPPAQGGFVTGDLVLA